MTEQCPKTCNRCTDDAASTVAPSSDCVDRVNPKTGLSDCPQLQYLCNNQQYFALMTEQCPKTCNRCTDAVGQSAAPPAATSSPSRKPKKPSTKKTRSPNANIASTAPPATTNSNSNCVDRVNPKTGVSDCPTHLNLCNDPVYRSLMTEQCPRTCNRCTDAVQHQKTPPSTAPTSATVHPTTAPPMPATTNKAITEYNADSLNLHGTKAKVKALVDHAARFPGFL
ncbi:shTK domain protein [Ancylostoma caninum]|uniref:ShTK domain protein n=1 Tax=Ancylostoma caninum TaxID=29170 RepID=A0A368GZS3_ANCCA|nr:shTK domain protein [Ancylostoma caninum]